MTRSLGIATVRASILDFNSASAMLPAQPQIGLLLAEAYARNQRAEAEKALRACIVWDSGSGQRDIELAARTLDRWSGSAATDVAPPDAQSQ